MSTCFRCPYDGPIAAQRAIALCEAVAGAGVDEVVVSDTLGDAGPRQIVAVCGPLLDGLGPGRLALHLHEKRRDPLVGRGVVDQKKAIFRASPEQDAVDAAHQIVVRIVDRNNYIDHGLP